MKAAILALAVWALAAPASATLVFDARFCEEASDCAIGSHGTSPGAQLPTEADFQAFYGQHLGAGYGNDHFTWTVATNANGYVFGHVEDEEGDAFLSSGYLFYNGNILCCTVVGPSWIQDGNDHNLFVGVDLSGTTSASQPIWKSFIATPGGPEIMTPIDYGLTPYARALIGDGRGTFFMAIDNDNHIFAENGSNFLELFPVSGQFVPEPATFALLLPFILGVFRPRRAARCVSP